MDGVLSGQVQCQVLETDLWSICLSPVPIMLPIMLQAGSGCASAEAANGPR